VGGKESRCAGRVPGLVSEGQGRPVPVLGPGLDLDLGAGGGHHAEEAIRVADEEGRRRGGQDAEGSGLEAAQPRGVEGAEQRGNLEQHEEDGEDGDEGTARSGESLGGRVRSGVGHPYDGGERVVVEQGEAEGDRQQVEEAVVPGGADGQLEDHECPERDEPGPAGSEDEEGHDELHGEHERARDALRQQRQLACVPRQGVGDGLRPVVVVEGGEVPPGGIAPRELGDAGAPHQLEHQDPQEPDRHRRRGRLAARPARSQVVPGRQEEGEEAGLGQEDVPLERQERLAEVDEGQVEGEAHGEERSLGEPQGREGGGRGSPVAHDGQGGVAGAEPAQGGQEKDRLTTPQPLRPLEELAGRQEASFAYEAVYLHAEGDEGHEVDQGQGPEEHGAGETEPRRADEVAHEEVDDAGGQGTVGGHKTVAPLRRRGESRDPPVSEERKAGAHEGEGPVDRLRAPAHPTVGLHEVDRGGKGLPGDVREAVVGRLVRLEGDPVPGAGAEVVHAAAAEAAVAVPDDEGALQCPDCTTRTGAPQLGSAAVARPLARGFAGRDAVPDDRSQMALRNSRSASCSSGESRSNASRAAAPWFA